jgi:hypothetical protein
MKYITACFALSIALLYLVIGLPQSAFSKIAAIVLGIALLYFATRARGSVKPMSLGEESGRGAGVASLTDTPLDDDLVARIAENLKIEPPEQLREMLDQSAGGRWSPEALQAARLVLDQRSNQKGPEPVYRTVPRTEQDQSAREGQAALAPGFSQQLLALDVGSRICCQWRGETGTIMRWQDEEERFYIRYDTGEGEWATLGMFK